MATTYFCSNRSDHVLTNSKTLGRRPVVNISKITYMVINLLLNSINRGLSNLSLQEKGSILQSEFFHCHQFGQFINCYYNKNTTSQNLQRLEKPIPLIYFHVMRNLANCVFNQLIFQFRIVCTPFGPDMKYFPVVCFVEMG